MLNQINEDLKLAMKDADKFSLSVLRMLKSALQLESINLKHELNDQEIMAVVKKQVKVRKDSKEEYEKYNKLDQVKDLEKEIDILSKYLPEEASESDILRAIDAAFDKLKPTSMKDMGSVMKEVNAILSNADMTIVSKLVKEKLSSL